jgi:Type II CAAX prenyl endopeptidase Rce1-like
MSYRYEQRPQRATQPKGIRAFGPIGATGRSVGALGLILMVQLGIYVAVIDNSTILPGNWASYFAPMTFYLFTFFAALFLLALRRDVLVATSITITSFVLRLSAFSAATWVIMSLAYLATNGVSPLADTVRLQDFVFVGFFVAPVEELFFRVALPKVLNSWILGSVIGFTLYHIPAYYLQTGGLNVGLLTSLTFAAVLGIILWLVYAPAKDGGILNMGYGATVGIHLTYDLFILGALGGVPLLLTHAALTIV